MRAWMTVALTIALAAGALARDNGQWEGTDPEVRAWYSRQMMPDFPMMSCCGESDAYWADIQVIDEFGTVFAIITDDRDDEALKRPHIPNGSAIIVPREKIKDPRPDPNPTGHGVLFVSSAGHVYCYINPPGGV